MPRVSLNRAKTRTCSPKRTFRKLSKPILLLESVDKYAYLATLEEIAENDFNLNIPRYVDTFEEEAEIDLMAVLQTSGTSKRTG